MYEKNIQGFLVGLKDHYLRMTNEHLLCLARNADGLTGVYRLQLHDSTTMSNLVSDRTVEAYASQNDALLRQIYSKSAFQAYKRYKEGEPDLLRLIDQAERYIQIEETDPLIQNAPLN